MSDRIIIVAMICVAALSFSTIVAVATYKRDRLEFLSKTEYKDIKSEITITSESENSQKK